MFAAVHESGCGPSRHFACANNQVAFRTKRTLDGMQDRRDRSQMTIQFGRRP
jgi:hypothetical protein